VLADIRKVTTSIEKSGTSYRSEILMCQCNLGHSSTDRLVMKSWHCTRTVYTAVYISLWRRCVCYFCRICQRTHRRLLEWHCEKK